MTDHHSSPLSDLAKAIFTINRHAKTAPKPQHLYMIKKEAINRLLKEKRAIKVGLHFSNNPKLSNQHSTLLVQVGSYYFHIPPTKDDFKKHKHLGYLDESYRNPHTNMSLSQAKRIIYRYINWSPARQKQHQARLSHNSSYFTPSSLGQPKRPPMNSTRY